jgi:ATP synthase protein I
MTDEPKRRTPPTFAEEIDATARRKILAQKNPAKVWFGLGMMGLIGWSVAIPTLLGAALGLWLDERQSRHSWTLALLVAGLVLGCFTAWHWVAEEGKAIRAGDEDHDG